MGSRLSGRRGRGLAAAEQAPGVRRVEATRNQPEDDGVLGRLGVDSVTSVRASKSRMSPFIFLLFSLAPSAKLLGGIKQENRRCRVEFLLPPVRSC
jgi:hypothetical protein